MLFTPYKLGPVLLRNRSIRSAAFEGMCPGNNVSDDLIDYHASVAAGGIGMTTVAYAAVCRSGLSFPHQLLITESAIPALRRLTNAIHKEGAAAAIQIGHCGLMAKKSISGVCFAPTGKFNLYGPTWPRTITVAEIEEIVQDFARAIYIVKEAGFDAVEVHAGHGYLISQFLSPYTNQRKDRYGGSFENRTRFMTEVIRKVIEASGSSVAVIVKMNLRDGFPGGMEMDESLLVAKMLEKEGVDGLVLSGGFVSKSPMYVMRGRMPVKVMAKYMNNPWMQFGTRFFGNFLMKPEPFNEGYFLEDAMKIRKEVKLALIYVGGLKSKEMIDKTLGMGFEFIQLARVLIHDPAFMNKLKSGELVRSGCESTNYCIARMYSGKMTCYQNEPGGPEEMGLNS